MRLQRSELLGARLAVIAALALIAVVSLPASAFAQAMAGSITTASGQAEILRGTTVLAANPGTAVDVGDQLVTGSNGHILATLTDASTLELGANSKIRVDQHTRTPAATRLSLLFGALRSFVNKTAGAAAPNFEVHTPNAIAAARGTRFDTVYISSGMRPGYGDCHAFTDVSVYSGVVSLANLNNPTAGVNVPAGYEATVPCAMAPTPAGPLGMTGASSFSAAAPPVPVTGIPSTIAPVPPPPTNPPPPPPPPPPPQPPPPSG
jgi:FecR protein